MKTIIISLGGSVIVPKKFNLAYLKKFKQLVLDFVKKGNRMVLVTGGGQTNRDYNKAARQLSKISDQDLDWIGIYTTKLNAQLVRSMFGKLAFEKIIENPINKIKTNKKILIGSGWLPGCSSDKDAVLLAKNLKSKTIINLFDQDYVYDKDPDKFKNAKPFKKLSWSKYKKMFSMKWSPRLSSPFDPEAAKLAQKLKMKVVIIKGTNLKNIKNYLLGKKFRGTEIS